MRVNKAITRLANKKQMETDNLSMLFVFLCNAAAMHNLLHKFYNRYSGRCNRAVVTSHIYFTWACMRAFYAYLERTSSPVWLGFLQGAPWHVCRLGHLSVQPRQGSNSGDCLGEAVMICRVRFELPQTLTITEYVNCCQRYAAISD